MCRSLGCFCFPAPLGTFCLIQLCSNTSLRLVTAGPTINLGALQLDSSREKQAAHPEAMLLAQIVVSFFLDPINCEQHRNRIRVEKFKSLPSPRPVAHRGSLTFPSALGTFHSHPESRDQHPQSPFPKERPGTTARKASLTSPQHLH